MPPRCRQVRDLLAASWASIAFLKESRDENTKCIDRHVRGDETKLHSQTVGRVTHAVIRGVCVWVGAGTASPRAREGACNESFVDFVACTFQSYLSADSINFSCTKDSQILQLPFSGKVNMSFQIRKTC